MGSPILLKIVSENQFSGKTYFYTIHPCLGLQRRGRRGRARGGREGRADLGEFVGRLREGRPEDIAFGDVACGAAAARIGGDDERLGVLRGNLIENFFDCFFS